MARAKIIVKPKKIVSRKARKQSRATIDTDYLLKDSIIKYHTEPTDELPFKKSRKKERLKRKKDRKKSRERKKLKKENRKIIKVEPVNNVDYGDYEPTVSIFDEIEDSIMDIPDEVHTWQKGKKGFKVHDLSSFKMGVISLVRDLSVDDTTEIKEYFINNENAIKEEIDGFNYVSNEEQLYTSKNKLLTLLNFGYAPSAEILNYLELFE